VRNGLICLSGHNIRAVVALCRWAAAADVPIHLIARDAADPIYLTSHASRVVEQRSSSALDVGEVRRWIEGLRKRHGYEQVVLAPSTEYFNRFLLRHRAAVEAAGGIVPLVDEALYVRISDKHAFAEMCQAHAIPVPAVFDDLPDRLPFVAKPRRYPQTPGAQIKPYLVFTAQERQQFLERERAQDHFFQEFVEGESLYLLAHVARDGTITASAQENLMQQAHGGSIILARSHDFHLEPEARAYFDMLVRAGFHGLVMIEVRRCRRTGRAVMIEANPRMWGPLQFMLDTHVDLLTPLLHDHGMEVGAPRESEPARDYYFWPGGLAPRLPACTFHNFSPDRFVQDYGRIEAASLFARDDTQRLHRHELSHV